MTEPPKSITVNIDDWLAERQASAQGLKFPAQAPTIQLPATAATPEEQAVILEEQRRIKERWMATQELEVRKGKLVEGTPECVECGEQRQQYKDDYVCYRCRDKMEE